VSNPGRRAAQAAVRPLNLAPVGIGAMAAGGLAAVGLGPAAVALAGLSLVTWGALVAWDVVSGAPKPPPRLRSARLEALLGAVGDAAARVRAALDAPDAAFAPALAELRGDCADLVSAARSAATRGDSLFVALAAQDPKALRDDAAQRAHLAETARDPEVRRSLQAAAEARARTLAAWDEVYAAHERICAELIAAEATLGELHARAVNLSLQAPEATSAVATEVKEIRSRLQLLERAAEATLLEVG
jgi:hypothetical protein